MADEKAVVDAEACVDCGVCVDACPAEAISME
jgi:ferredoxin